MIKKFFDSKRDSSFLRYKIKINIDNVVDERISFRCIV